MCVINNMHRSWQLIQLKYAIFIWKPNVITLFAMRGNSYNTVLFSVLPPIYLFKPALNLLLFV